ncbi:MAG: SGNH/GDSL hydrolase family protein [Alphaproteobacteria bacterium]|nr:SGNH/GDSL hydrolase family protein [Alphaproteobacteria bacterium]
MKVKSLSFHLLAMLLVLALAGALLEIGMRIAFARSMDFDIEMWKYAMLLKQPSSNPRIGHEHKPHSRAFLMGADVQINSIGLRDIERPAAKPQGVKRILMLGDSLTFGWGVEMADTPSRLLAQLFSAHGSDVDVINSGVGNYNTDMEVSYFFQEGVKLDPDLVVLNYYINDAETTPAQQTGFFRQNSYAFAFISGRIGILFRLLGSSPDWREYYQALYDDSNPGWARAKAAIARLAAYCRQRDIPLIVVNYPELHELTPYPFLDVTAKLRAAAFSSEADFLDLLPAVSDLEPKSLWVSPMDAHPNPASNRAFAKLLYDTITLKFATD